MFPLPLQLDNDQLSRDDVAEGTLDYGHARRRPFRGIIDFGRFGSVESPTPDEIAQAQAWHADIANLTGPRWNLPMDVAIAQADRAHPFAMGGVPGQRTPLGRVLDAGIAEKAAADAKLKAQAVDVATQGAKVSADITSQQIAAQQARDAAARGQTSTTLIDPRTGQQVTVGPATAASSDNTMMYVGAAAVALGLAFLAKKRSSRGSLSGYSRRHRKSRRSKRRSKR